MKFERLFLSFSLIFSTVFTVLVAFALFGFFTKITVFIVLLLGVFSFFLDTFFLLRSRFSRADFSWRGLFVSFFLVLVFASTVFFHHDVPRGRDPMGFLSAAQQLTLHKTLSFSDVFTHPFHPFRLVREPNIFTSQFFPGFVVYLGSFMLFGGVSAALASGALVATLSLMAMFFIGKRITGFWAGTGMIMLLGTSYLFLWFPRRTVSENLFMFFLWFAVFLFIRGYQQKNIRSLFLAFFPLSLSLLVRVEGLSLFFSFLGVFLGVFLARDFSKHRKFGWPEFLLLIFSFSPTVLLPIYFFRFGDQYLLSSFTHGSLLQIMPFGIAAIVLLPLFLLFSPKIFSFIQRYPKYFSTIFLSAILVVAVLFLFFRFSPQDFVSWKHYRTIFVFETFLRYGFGVVFAFIFLGLFKRWFQKEHLLLTFLLLPFAVFFLDPLIALDQPWFMRRFFSAVIPFFFLLVTHVLIRIFAKKPTLFPKIFFVMALFQIFFYAPISFQRDHAGVSRELDRFAATHSRDAVYIMTPGWDWQQWAYALHYIYGFQILPNFDNLTRDEISQIFSSSPEVYIISKSGPGSVPGILSDNTSFSSSFSFSYPELIKTSNINAYLDANDLLEVGFLRFSQRNTPPRNIRTVYENWDIYRINNVSEIDVSFVPETREEYESD